MYFLDLFLILEIFGSIVMGRKWQENAKKGRDFPLSLSFPHFGDGTRGHLTILPVEKKGK